MQIPGDTSCVVVPSHCLKFSASPALPFCPNVQHPGALCDPLATFNTQNKQGRLQWTSQGCFFFFCYFYVQILSGTFFFENTNSPDVWWPWNKTTGKMSFLSFKLLHLVFYIIFFFFFFFFCEIWHVPRIIFSPSAITDEIFVKHHAIFFSFVLSNPR